MHAHNAAESDEVRQLRSKYQSKLATAKELFPDWTDEDILYAIHDANGDVEVAIVRMSEGTPLAPLPQPPPRLAAAPHARPDPPPPELHRPPNLPQTDARPHRMLTLSLWHEQVSRSSGEQSRQRRTRRSRRLLPRRRCPSRYPRSAVGSPAADAVVSVRSAPSVSSQTSPD